MDRGFIIISGATIQEAIVFPIIPLQVTAADVSVVASMLSCRLSRRPIKKNCLHPNVFTP